ncbi:hypothetical protein LIER_10161 [Lithospermum erythrorhizon]|uniref:Uncharacterized protein n=1 Tax=Lithospermum erythrorhizon TaxID=34254 RepID=A0AAV3PJJ5_LITER
MEEEHDASTLRGRRKAQLINISCCFHNNNKTESNDLSSPCPPATFSSGDSRKKSALSPIWNVRSTHSNLSSPHHPHHHHGPHEENIVGRCKSLISRSKGGGRRSRRASLDFSYDPFTYSLNFEDDQNNETLSSNHEFEDDAIHRSFNARLPVSPKRSTSAIKITH